MAQYWSDNFDAFKDQKNEDGTPKKSLYAGCEASDASTAVVKVSRVTSKFPNILGLPSFTIQSPTALQQYDANNVTGDVDAYTYPAYALEHPTGTGPFKFAKYDTANGTVELVRNDDYWGDKAKLAKLIFKIIPDESARKQELQAGTIDGYDLPSPGDWDALTAAGFNVAVRPAFNILYLGLEPEEQPGAEGPQGPAGHRLRPQPRTAGSAASWPKGQRWRSTSIPSPWMAGRIRSPSTPDPEKAKSSSRRPASRTLTLNFFWPTEVSRAVHAQPERHLPGGQGRSRGSRHHGRGTRSSWQPYLDAVDDQQADAFIVGWTGDYNTPDNFLGSFFSRTTGRFGTQYYDWGQSCPMWPRPTPSRTPPPGPACTRS